jgi:hypothetical protein
MLEEQQDRTFYRNGVKYHLVTRARVSPVLQAAMAPGTSFGPWLDGPDSPDQVAAELVFLAIRLYLSW